MTGVMPFSGKVPALEALRGFAALTVVLYHLDYGGPLSGNAFVKHGYLLVDFFFVLSGFVIALNYRHRLGSMAEIVAFQRRRFWRLYPLHLATLLVFLAIEVAKWQFERKTGVVANTPAFSASNGTVFGLHLMLLQGVVLQHPGFNVPSWSISTEFWVYLLFGLLVMALRRWLVVAVLLAGLCAAVMIEARGGLLNLVEPGFALLRCIYSFFLGAIALVVVQDRAGHLPWGALAGPLVIASILAVMMIGGSRFEIAIPLLFAVTVVAVARADSRSLTRWVLERRWFVWLGAISYSIYMTHSIVGWFVTQAMRFGLGVPTKAHATLGQVVDLAAGPATLALLTGLAGVIALSAFTHRFIEERFRHGWPRRLPHSA
jgi:peptidoglycan/LPS O-acetylase OafA/YrhL